MTDRVEIVVRGGLPGDGMSHACIPGTGLSWQRRPAETETAFRERVRTEAQAAGADALVFDGLPE